MKQNPPSMPTIRWAGAPDPADRPAQQGPPGEYRRRLGILLMAAGLLASAWLLIPPGKGFLGVRMEGNALGPDGREGALVVDVVPGYPAERAGLLPGDIVLSVDGRRVLGSGPLMNEVSSMRPGREITLTVRRGGAELTLPVVLDERPAELDRPPHDD
jgi:hypothetical protein